MSARGNQYAKCPHVFHIVGIETYCSVSNELKSRTVGFSGSRNTKEIFLILKANILASYYVYCVDKLFSQILLHLSFKLRVLGLIKMSKDCFTSFLDY